MTARDVIFLGFDFKLTPLISSDVVRKARFIRQGLFSMKRDDWTPSMVDGIIAVPFNDGPTCNLLDLNEDESDKVWRALEPFSSLSLRKARSLRRTSNASQVAHKLVVSGVALKFVEGSFSTLKRMVDQLREVDKYAIKARINTSLHKNVMKFKSAVGNPNESLTKTLLMKFIKSLLEYWDSLLSKIKSDGGRLAYAAVACSQIVYLGKVPSGDFKTYNGNEFLDPACFLDLSDQSSALAMIDDRSVAKIATVLGSKASVSKAIVQMQLGEASSAVLLDGAFSQFISFGRDNEHDYSSLTSLLVDKFWTKNFEGLSEKEASKWNDRGEDLENSVLVKAGDPINPNASYFMEKIKEEDLEHWLLAMYFESRFNVFAVNQASGAVGLLQLMSSTIYGTTPEEYLVNADSVDYLIDMLLMAEGSRGASDPIINAWNNFLPSRKELENPTFISANPPYVIRSLDGVEILHPLSMAGHVMKDFDIDLPISDLLQIRPDLLNDLYGS